MIKLIRYTCISIPRLDIFFLFFFIILFYHYHNFSWVLVQNYGNGQISEKGYPKYCNFSPKTIAIKSNSPNLILALHSWSLSLIWISFIYSQRELRVWSSCIELAGLTFNTNSYHHKYTNSVCSLNSSASSFPSEREVRSRSLRIWVFVSVKRVRTFVLMPKWVASSMWQYVCVGAMTFMCKCK